jgi:hypothetical protein
MKNYPNIIIGAGPAGIQLAYYFKKEGIKYIILEKSTISGSFFDNYPLSGKLISINKKHTGNDNPDFNLRHDWNSLISDNEDLLFTNYSNDYYPDHNDLVKYLNDFSQKHELNIKYGMKVMKVKKGENNVYTLEVMNDKGKLKEYTTEKLIIATGLSKAVIPKATMDVKVNIKHYADFEKNYFKNPENLNKYKNKSLLIIGNGNAAYELGNLLNSYCSTIAIIGRSIKKWAATTHYTGDLRSVYLPFIDTFLLKSLNSFDVFDDKNTYYDIIQETENDKYIVSLALSENSKIQLYFQSISGFDHIIFCTGWKFDDSIFDFKINLTQNDKYPEVLPNYESTNNSNLFFVGSLMHSLDFKKSSGGFIHGFRYLIRNFVNVNYNIPPVINVFKLNNLNSLTKHMYEKINKSSALYQMYGQLIDFFYIDSDTKEIKYYNNVSKQLLLSDYYKINNKQYYTFSLEYGTDIITDYELFGKAITRIGKESKSVLLHPVFRAMHYDPEFSSRLENNDFPFNPLLIDEVHFDEDIFANFANFQRYYEKLFRTLNMFI